MARVLLRNLSQLATPLGDTAVRGAAMRSLHVVADAALVFENERIVFADEESKLDPAMRFDVEIDCRRGVALPGFVDTHTHIPFAGARESEFNRRLSGETYEQIAASGGGIASTVRSTRAASQQELSFLVMERVERMALYGTTTCEAKSGYGLNLQDELKQLMALRDASSVSPVRIVSTALPAHDVPPEARGSAAEKAAYLDQVVEEILPAIAREKLARFCDVFVERGVYTRDEGERVLRKGRELGFTPRIHADELSDTDGAALASELDAASADHLMYISDRGIRALAASNTVANLLPATSFFLMSERFAPARELIDQGAIVSLSTDSNPGTSMTESMQVVMLLASLRMKMTVEEALTAATLNGAYSLGLASECGSLEVGKSADVVVLDAPSYLHLVYHFGVNLVRDVFSRGRRIVADGHLTNH